MNFKWLDNTCYVLDNNLSATDSILPLSNSDAARLCSELEDGYTYLTIMGPRGNEIVRVSCSNGNIVIIRAQGESEALAFSECRKVCFEVNKPVMDAYIEEAMLGGCKPTIVVDEDSENYIEVLEPEEDSCEWTIKLSDYFIDSFKECCHEDECEPCVLPNGVYENATITIVNGKVCGISNGTNIVYTGGSCCGCQSCNSEESGND